jgi:hypothetical protein
MFIITNCDKGLSGCLWGFFEFCDLYIFYLHFVKNNMKASKGLYSMVDEV